MKYLAVTLLAIVSFLCFTGCNDNNGNKLGNIDKNEYVRIKNWSVLGPFTNSDTVLYNSEKAIDEDFLTYFKTSEHTVDWKTFQLLNEENCNLKSVLGYEFSNGVGDAGVDVMNLSEHYFFYDTTTSNTAYLAYNVFSKLEQEVYFLYNACELTKLYCNGVLLNETTFNSHFSTYYLAHVPVTLKQGNNFILLKVNRFKKKRWQVMFDIAGKDYAFVSYYRDYAFNFLDNPIADKDTLYINTKPFKSKNQLQYTVTDLHDKEVLHSDNISIHNQMNDQLRVNLTGLEDGIYKIVLDADSVFSQYFFKGDIYERIKQLKSPLNKEEYNDEDLKGILLERVDFIVQKIEDDIKKYKQDVKLFWTRNLIETVRQLEQFYRKQDFNGLHFEAYRSRVDSSVSSYLCYVSEEQLNSGEPKPVMINLPFFIHNPPPFHESFYASNVNLIPWVCHYGEKNGFIVLYFYLRNTNGYYTLSETDFFDALNDVKNRYNVDTSRIFLMGNCRGGTRVLQFAAYHPDLFAGLALNGPMSKINTSNYQEICANPDNFTGNYKNHYIYIDHSEDDEIAPIDLSVQFIDKLKNYTSDYSFNRLTDISHFVFFQDFYKPHFEYLSGKHKKEENSFHYSLFENKYSRVYWCNIKDIVFEEKASIDANYTNNVVELVTSNVNEIEIDLSRLNIQKDKPVKVIVNDKVHFNRVVTGNNNTVNVELNKQEESLYKCNKWEGPISHLFNKKVVLVRGTIGGNISKKQINACIDSLQEKWNEKYYGNFKITDDIDVLENMDTETNYILFGNRNTNAVIKKAEHDLPVKTKPNYIQFREHELSDITICYNYIYPNIILNNGYFLIVGSNDDNVVKFLEYDIEKLGIDFILWEPTRPDDNLNRGFFNEFWY